MELPKEPIYSQNQNLHMGERIAYLRRERGVTQGELAAHFGVSTPAVSKWETGQSLPDVALIPMIAAYFNISLDALFDYRPQLTKEEIQAHYRTLAARFASEPFHAVAADCRALIKQYYCCWRLVLMMGLLLLNHASLAGQDAPGLLLELEGLFCRVKESSDNPGLSRQALNMQALCLILMEKTDEAIAILEVLSEDRHTSPSSLLIMAYQKKGDMEKARSLAQSELYIQLMAIQNCAPALMRLYDDDTDRLRAYYTRTLQVQDAFSMMELYPLAGLNLHLTAAILFMEAQDVESALDALTRYAWQATLPDAFPPKLKGGPLFDRLDDLFEDLDLGKDAPRNMILIKRDCLTAIENNPAFAPLHGHPRYQEAIRKMQRLLGDNNA